MEDSLKRFAKRLKDLREEKGMTHRELAKLIGCSSGLISHYENCKCEPGLTNILAMCRIFNETPDYLIGVTNVRRLTLPMTKVRGFLGR